MGGDRLWKKGGVHGQLPHDLIKPPSGNVPLHRSVGKFHQPQHSRRKKVRWRPRPSVTIFPLLSLPLITANSGSLLCGETTTFHNSLDRLTLGRTIIWKTHCSNTEEENEGHDLQFKNKRNKIKVGLHRRDSASKVRTGTMADTH